LWHALSTRIHDDAKKQKEKNKKKKTIGWGKEW
jgi:hypothetical protein